jgi:beta-mannosidase
MTSSPEPIRTATASSRARVDCHATQLLREGWQAAATEPDLHTSARDLEDLGWIGASVPGTAAGALRDAGAGRAEHCADLDAQDWWFRTSFEASPAFAGEEVVLCLDGIATVSEVHLNGELLLRSESMFAAHELDVGTRLRGRNELAIRCRALAPLLEVPRRPRARWRTRLVSHGGLRFFRTMLLGRAPGFAPGPAVVGPWRPVRLQRRTRVAVDELTLRPRLDGCDGVLSVRARLRALAGSTLGAVEVELAGPSGTHRATLAATAAGPAPGGIGLEGDLRVPDAARWWPHTHGEPALYEVRLLISDEAGAVRVEAGRVGFRELSFGAAAGHDVERDGLDLHVNGVPVFARGAVWTPADPVTMAPGAEELRRTLEHVRRAGMNMLRLPGTGAYETGAFHDLCDELGILVWQDFMFANLDYPIADEAFRGCVEREGAEVLEALGGRASLAVLCGNSEIEQQVAMLGLDPLLARGELFGEILPALVDGSGVDALFVPSAPCGGELPFRPDRGIANYYGVGGYRRPLRDARMAGVRFAAECLAFSNVPDAGALEGLLAGGQPCPPVHHPAWKAGVPRDNGAGWDFEDVRDHYLGLLFGVDAAELRRSEPDRYLDLSRAVTGEVMAEVFGEWRRSGSPCRGGLVLWLRDLRAGAGWGLLDHRGEPKAAYHHLRRALAPVAVWTVDEGLGGVVAHLANDLPRPLLGELRVALYSDGERRVGEASREIELAPHSQSEWNVEELLGRFVDASWAYRFGPPAQDAIIVSLSSRLQEGAATVCEAVRFPAGRPLRRESAESLGLSADAHVLGDGCFELELRAERLLYGVRVDAPGQLCSDDCFTLEPGVPRRLALAPDGPRDSPQQAGLSALNMSGRVVVSLESAPA